MSKTKTRQETRDKSKTRRGVWIFALLFLLSIPLRADIFTDDVGRRVDVKVPAKKIVCLSPGHTEMFFAMGQDKALAAVSAQCDYPREAAKKTKAGTFTNPDVELIAGMKPDLVISGGGIQKKAIARMEALGIPVIVLYPQTTNAIMDNMTLLGKLTGATAKAEKQRKKFAFRLAAASATPTVKAAKVYLELWNDPVMTVGSASFINELVRLAGGRNIFGDAVTDYPKASVEEVIKRDPEVIVLLYNPTDDFAARDYIKLTTAGREGTVKAFGDIDTILRPGPRIPEAVMKLRHIIELKKRE